MPSQEFLGWTSSVILFLTIAHQVYKQWSTGTSKGVSTWLYGGQLISSMGFVAYSSLVHNWVFVVTNAFLLFAEILGLVISIKHRRRENRRSRSSSAKLLLEFRPYRS